MTSLLFTIIMRSDMKSIKEKAEELYCIPRGDDTEDTVALDLDKAVTSI